MSVPGNKITLIILLILLFSSVVFAQEEIRFQKISIEKDYLCVSFSFDSLFNEKLVQGLDRGLTLSIKYDIEVWRSVKGWFDRIVSTKSIWFRISYNRLQKKYNLVSEVEKRGSNDLDRLKKVCTVLDNEEIVPADRLNINDRYYFNVKCLVKQLSIENIEDMSNWLRGGKKDGGQNKGGALKKAVELVANVTGLGDKFYDRKSTDFFKNSNNVIIMLN